MTIYEVICGGVCCCRYAQVEFPCASLLTMPLIYQRSDGGELRGRIADWEYIEKISEDLTVYKSPTVLLEQRGIGLLYSR